MAGSSNSGADDDWTDSGTRDVQAKLYELAIAPVHEAFALRWDAYVEAKQRESRTLQDLALEYAAQRKAYGMNAIEDTVLRRAILQARRIRGSDVSPSSMPDAEA